MYKLLRRSILPGSATLLSLLLAACAGGGGGGGSSGFELTSLNLGNGAIWQINRRIEFTFSQDVDFSTVSLNTINIRTSSGTPATGSFFLKPVDRDNDGQTADDAPDPRTVVFQPTCP